MIFSAQRKKKNGSLNYAIRQWTNLRPIPVLKTSLRKARRIYFFVKSARLIFKSFTLPLDFVTANDSSFFEQLDCPDLLKRQKFILITVRSGFYFQNRKTWKVIEFPFLET